MKRWLIVYGFFSITVLSASHAKQAEVFINPDGGIFCRPYDPRLVPHFSFPITIKNYSSSSSENTQAIRHLPNNLEPQKSYLASLHESFTHKTQSFMDSLSTKHIVWATGISFVIAYAIIAYKLKKIEAALENPNAWGNWKRELPAEKFFGQKESDLSEALINAIQIVYCDFKHPTDTTKPLQQFLKAYKQELSLYKSYFTLIQTLSFLRCTRLFKCNKEAMELKIKDRIERLTFIRTLFLHWVTQHRTFHQTMQAA